MNVRKFESLNGTFYDCSLDDVTIRFRKEQYGVAKVSTLAKDVSALPRNIDLVARLEIERHEKARV